MLCGGCRRGDSAVRIEAPEEFEKASAIRGTHFGELDAESAPFFRETHDPLHADFSFMKGKKHFDDRSNRHRITHGNEHAAGAQIADARYDAGAASRPCDPYPLRHGDTSVTAVIFGDLFRHFFVWTNQAQRQRSLNGAERSGGNNRLILYAPAFETSACARRSIRRTLPPERPTLLAIAH